jgi:hypothetical protein
MEAFTYKGITDGKYVEGSWRKKGKKEIFFIWQEKG